MTNRIMGYLYDLSLALWVGGMAIYSFVITPAIFGSFDRDAASRIVDGLFGGYFAYTLSVSAGALLCLILMKADRKRPAFRASLALVALAAAVNLFVSYSLYPRIKAVKRQVGSFVAAPKESGPRRQFGRLHGISAGLNLLVLADGIVLVYLRRRLGGDGG